MSEMLTAAEWLGWLLRHIPVQPPQALAVFEAHGHVLAEDVRSPHPIPLWTNSAMDGYAVRAGDLERAGPDHPITLQVVGEVPAGSSSDPWISPGHAVRIMTGASVPSDADAVVPVEMTLGDRESDTTKTGRTAWADHTVRVLQSVPLGANIRLAGEDTPAGGLLARAGQNLSAARLAALAAAGIERVSVRKKPRVAVVVTGSELCPPGSTLQRGQIFESNSVLIAGLLREMGIEPGAVLYSVDDATELRVRLTELATQCDFIITTGGIGPGTHDVVRIALEAEHAVRSVKVAIRPGAPQAAGPLKPGGFIFALPGNPVSAAVGFEVFVRPALRAAQGYMHPERVQRRAVAAEGWRGRKGRLQVMPVTLRENAEGLVCEPCVNPSAVPHSVGGHGATEAYAIVEEERGDVMVGEAVRVIEVGA